MARLTRHEETEPKAIKVAGETVWICRCGLTKNEPYCDNSHELCKDEDDDFLYEYTEKGERIALGKKVSVDDEEDISLDEQLERKAKKD